MFNLKEITSIYAQLSESSIQKINEISELVHLPKNHLLYKPNVYEGYVYFIAKGSARAYIQTENNEITFWLGLEKQLLLAFNEYMFDGISYEYIELLEDCSLFKIKNSDLKILYETDIDLANFGRKLAEYFGSKSEIRIIERLALSATARYELLIKENPDFLKRIPLKHIASYLGVTQVSLSRIRASL